MFFVTEITEERIERITIPPNLQNCPQSEPIGDVFTATMASIGTASAPGAGIVMFWQQVRTGYSTRAELW